MVVECRPERDGLDDQNEESMLGEAADKEKGVPPKVLETEEPLDSIPVVDADRGTAARHEDYWGSAKGSPLGDEPVDEKEVVHRSNGEKQEEGVEEEALGK